MRVKLYCTTNLPACLPALLLAVLPRCLHQTWLLFVLLSVVSMAMGFYDLWKNVPYFKQFVVGMFRPAAAVFEWLEGHTQVRGAGPAWTRRQHGITESPGEHSGHCIILDVLLLGAVWNPPQRGCTMHKACVCHVMKAGDITSLRSNSAIALL